MNKRDKLTEATMLALQGKLTETKRTIVYDDEGGELETIKDIIENNIDVICKRITPEHSWGDDRIRAENVKAVIEDFINNMESDDILNYVVDLTSGKVTHANNIGNNNDIEIIVKYDDAEKIIGYLSITEDMFGNVYISIKNLGNNKIGFDSFNMIRCNSNKEIYATYDNR